MNLRSRPQHLRPQQVEWLPSSPDEIEVRVRGVWDGPTVPPAVVLVVGTLRVPALPDAAPGRPPAWGAAFRVPVEARAAIEAGEAMLDVEGTLVALPAGGPGRLDTDAEGPEEGGTVIDPAVLAERRARRAELAERTANERAATAEQAAETLRVQLSNLEERLVRATGERDALAARVADAERRLRLAEQREEAERRRRSELEAEAAAERRRLEEELRSLRERLASAREVAEALERELAEARRRQDAAEAAASRVDERLRAALERVAELEAAPGERAEELRRRLSEAGREAVALRERLVASEARLAEERAAREAAERRADDERVGRAAAERRAEQERAEREAAERNAEQERAEREAAERRADDERALRVAAERRVDEERAGRAAAERRAEEERASRQAAERRADEERASRQAAERRAEEARAGREAAERRADEERAGREAAERRATALEAAGARPAGERERALAAQVTALQAELARRTETQARVQEAIALVRSELASIRERVEAGRAGSAALRAEVDALERRQRELEEELRTRERELAAARAQEARHRADLEEAESAMAELRAALDQERAARENAEAAVRAELDARIEALTAEVTELRRRLAERTAELEARLAEEERRRAAAEAALAAGSEQSAGSMVRIEVAGRAETPPDDGFTATATPGADDPATATPGGDHPATATPGGDHPATPTPPATVDPAASRGAADAIEAASTPAERSPDAEPRRSGADAPGAEGDRWRAAAGDTAGFPATGDAALDALIAGLREQVASARAELESWDAETAGRAERPASLVDAGPQAPDAPAKPPQGAEASAGSVVVEGPAPDPAAARSATQGTSDAPRTDEDPAERARRRLEALEADIRATASSTDAATPAGEIIASIQEAAARLRAAAEEQARSREEETHTSGTDAGEPSADAEAPAAAGENVPAAGAEAEADCDAEPRGEQAEPAETVELGARSAEAPRREAPWLRTAIERLAERDAARAAELLLALLPAQAALDTRLVYTVSGPGLPTARVTVEPGSVRVERDAAPDGADARVSGSIAALAPLAAGGAGWRLKGLQVKGRKRRVRKLARARRHPLTLADVASLDPPLAPDLLLAALCAAIDPAWTAGNCFGVSYVVDGERWTVVADDGRPLELRTNGDGHPHSATVTLTRAGLLAVVRGDASPAGEPATVAGDRRVVNVLHGWFDRARGVAAG